MLRSIQTTACLEASGIKMEGKIHLIQMELGSLSQDCSFNDYQISVQPEYVQIAARSLQAWMCDLELI